MVKTVQFSNERDTGYPITAASTYDGQRVDELMFLDIEASEEGRGTFLEMIKEISEECLCLFV